MKYCKNCKKVYGDSYKFSEDCGGKLTKLVEHEEEQKKEVRKKNKLKQNNRFNKMYFIPMVLVLLIFFYILFSNFYSSSFYTRSGDKNFQSQNNDISNNPSSNIHNCRIVNEPYQDCINVQVPYQAEETYTDYLKATVVDSSKTSSWDLSKGTYMIGIVKLKNIDSEAGWFTVTFNWRTLNNQYTDTVRHYIEPDKIVEFKSIYDVKTGEDNELKYSYKSDPVSKTRTVTKYRTEQKCETKYKTVKKCD